MKDERTLVEGFSRRGLIKTIGMGGLAIAASGGLGLLSQAEAKGKSTNVPWPYKTLSEANG